MTALTVPQSGQNIAIIGGGIAGLGVARALLNAGYRVTVFERNAELAKETSNNSLRIIHGGFRYLQQLALLRIIDSVRDQNFCLQNYPQVIRPLTSFMPLSRFGMKSKIPVFLATVVYGLFLRTLRSPLPSPKVISKTDAEKSFPWAKGFFEHGALSWTDAQLLSHHNLVKQLSEEIISAGGSIRTSSEVICKNLTIENAGEKFVQVFITEIGKEISVEKFDFCVEAIGHNANKQMQRFNCGFVRAFNLVFKASERDVGALGFSGKGGRLFFLVPRGESSGHQEVALGTEYLPYSASVEVSRTEIESFYAAALAAQPNLPFTLDQLVRVECGVVPTEKPGTTKLKGRTEIVTNGRIVSLLPSKYTTFKSVGERVTRVIQAMK